MNVKIRIGPVTAEYFRKLGEGHAEGFGGYEPIPDAVISHPGIAGGWRRRKYGNTLRYALLAIEVKASGRDKKRLGPGEAVNGILKVDALRIEARDRKSDVLPPVVTIDTAPEASERMTPYARHEVEAAARECRVCLFYAPPSEDQVVLPQVL